MNTPNKTFFLVAWVVLMLIGLHFIPTVNVMGWESRRVSILSDLMPEEEPSAASDSASAADVQRIEEAKQQLEKEKEFVEEWAEGVTPIIDYGTGKKGTMQSFYDKLNRVDQLGRPVRVCYYGDSYIEGDILVCDLRELFQQTFGGCGVGWIDCANALNSNRPTLRQRNSGFSAFSSVRKPCESSRLGVAGTYYTATEGASFTISGSDWRKHCKDWQVAQLFFRSPSGMTISVTAGGETLTNKAEASQSVQMLRTDGQVSQITYKLSGTSGATLYGAALEGEKGVVIDNMSLRGSGGGNLAGIPVGTLKDFARLRPYDLIVFQFGLNVCSNRSSEAGLKAYIASMDKVIDNFREAYPEAAILIVSMPDRDQRTASGIHTIPQVKTLVHLQEGMALDHKAAFFNLFECMGGDDAMKGLVEKGLGQKDYTHMNYKGGTELAGRMFQSFQGGLANHKRRIGETKR